MPAPKEKPFSHVPYGDYLRNIVDPALEIAERGKTKTSVSPKNVVQFQGLKSDTDADRNVVKKNLDEIFSILSRNPALVGNFRSHPVFQQFATPPIDAPEKTFAAQFAGRPKWTDKAARKGRNPAQFIRDEYGEELAARSLTRAILHEHDFALYQAYASWIRPGRHPEDDLGLPTQPKTDLDELEDPLAHIRAGARTSNARARARKQRQNPGRSV